MEEQKMTDEVKSRVKKPKIVKKNLPKQKVGDGELLDSKSKPPKKKKSVTQDNQVLFSRPSTMSSGADGEDSRDAGDKYAVQEDSAPSGMEHDPTRLYLHELGYKPLLTAPE